METSRSTDRCLNSFENKCPNKYQGLNGINLNQILNHIFRSIWFSNIFSKAALKKWKYLGCVISKDGTFATADMPLGNVK